MADDISPALGLSARRRERHNDVVLVITDTGAIALMLAIMSGVVAIVLQETWQPVHDCGNRYCRHVDRSREDDAGWHRP